MLNELKEELVNLSSDDEEFIKDVFNEIDFYDEIIDKKELSKEDKKKVDKIMEDVDIILNAINYYANKNIYSRFYKLFVIIQIFMSYEFYENLAEFYGLVDRYQEILDEIDFLIDSYKERSIEDISIASKLSYLSYLTVKNDVKEADYTLFNFKKFEDSDILDVPYSNDKRDMLFLTLKSQNRKYRNSLNN